MRRFLIFVLLCLMPGSLSLAQTELVCEDIQAETDDLAYYVGLGNGYLTQGDFNEALIVFSCALEVDASYTPALVARGLSYASQGNLESALNDYNLAIEQDENSIEAYINRGNLYTQQGRFGLALNDFDLVIALDPDNAIAYNNRAVVYATEGDYDFAIEDLQMAISLDPDYPAPYASLGVVYSAMAVEQYASYRELSGDRRLPAGDADLVIASLELERETGTFNTWLALQTASE